ncbi:hypothetical protein BS50DRAFT_633921 [Corynespora cassiicola Philippines]|uniref:GPI anchored protein n=1 Tax=Corynespora cassiicola Philippines TaxID=1448308 RepID=A0A2T2NTB6_CORCC|nr:hypothetical protein BS50DRAFT_633921 [Corynespora cassiicola Philippines]
MVSLKAFTIAAALVAGAVAHDHDECAAASTVTVTVTQCAAAPGSSVWPTPPPASSVVIPVTSETPVMTHVTESDLSSVATSLVASSISSESSKISSVATGVSTVESTAIATTIAHHTTPVASTTPPQATGAAATYGFGSVAIAGVVVHAAMALV